MDEATKILLNNILEGQNRTEGKVDAVAARCGLIETTLAEQKGERIAERRMRHLVAGAIGAVASLAVSIAGILWK